MRTTLTIDDSIAILLERENRRAKEPMKQTVNRMLLSGLKHAATPVKRKAFKVVPLNLGTTPEQWERWKDMSVQEILDDGEEGYLR